MPYTGELRSKRGRQEDIGGSCSSYYSHDNESVSPGYYSLKMDNGVRIEMTASTRTALHRITYPEAEGRRLLINLEEGNGDGAYDTYLRQTDAHTVEGYRFSKGWGPHKVFFALTTDKPIRSLALFDADTPSEGSEIRCKGAKGVLTFDDEKQVMVKVAISSVSSANALENLRTEIPGWDFKAVQAEAIRRWNDELAAIDIETADETAKKDLLHGHVPRLHRSDDLLRRQRRIPRTRRQGRQRRRMDQLLDLLAVGHLPRPASALHADPSGPPSGYRQFDALDLRPAVETPDLGAAGRRDEHHAGLQRRAGDLRRHSQGHRRLRHRAGLPCDESLHDPSAAGRRALCAGKRVHSRRQSSQRHLDRHGIRRRRLGRGAGGQKSSAIQPITRNTSSAENTTRTISTSRSISSARNSKKTASGSRPTIRSSRSTAWDTSARATAGSTRSSCRSIPKD